MDGINQEYSMEWNGFSDGVQQFNSDTVSGLFQSIPKQALFPLSRYESTLGFKNWWTLEMEDSILLQEHHWITVTYPTTVCNYHRTNGDVFIFINGKLVLEMAGTPADSYSMTVYMKSVNLPLDEMYAFSLSII